MIESLSGEERRDELRTVYLRRSADELCRGSRYAPTEPVITTKGWSFDRYGGGTDITVRTELTCQ